MTRTMAGTIGAMLAAGALTCGAGTIADDEGDLGRRIAAIKLPESQRKWERIPWVADLAEGRRMARKEHRPIFLWVTGDEPLERC